MDSVRMWARHKRRVVLPQRQDLSWAFFTSNLNACLSALGYSFCFNLKNSVSLPVSETFLPQIKRSELHLFRVPLRESTVPKGLQLPVPHHPRCPPMLNQKHTLSSNIYARQDLQTCHPKETYLQKLPELP